MTTNAVTTDATASGVAHSARAPTPTTHAAAAEQTPTTHADAAHDNSRTPRQRASRLTNARGRRQPMVPAKDLAPWGRGRV